MLHSIAQEIYAITDQLEKMKYGCHKNAREVMCRKTKIGIFPISIKKILLYVAWTLRLVFTRRIFMEINALPKYDTTDNPTHCCPRFNTRGWDGQELHFKDKLFVKARTRSIFHIPVNMGSVFPKTFAAIEKAGANVADEFIVLTRDTSAWSEEHFFSVSKDVPGQTMVHMTGDYLTKVFEGAYKNAPVWEKEMDAFVKSKGKQTKKAYFFYTTCPKCATFYGKNYVVAVSEIQ